MAILALPHEEIEGVEAHLCPSGRVRPRTLRADGLAEHAPEEIRVHLSVPAAHFEVSGTTVAVHDDTDILMPVELPKERTVRTDTVIDGHRMLLSSCWSRDAFRKNSLPPGEFFWGAYFCYCSARNFSGSRNEESGPNGPVGAGWRL